MSKAKTHEEAPASPAIENTPKGGLIPKPLMILFVIVLGAGVLVGATRHARTASAMLDTMVACDASVLPEKDGISDAYGVVKFNSRQNEIMGLLSLCDTDPPLSREIFRTALERRNKSSQLIALYSSFYLAGSGQLEKDDWDRMLSCLDPEKEKSEDVRKAAQRALSDLTFIADKSKGAAYQTVPAGVKEVEGVTNRVQTHEENLKAHGITGLNVRWSTAELALAWLKEFAPKGKWDGKLQRYVWETVPATK